CREEEEQRARESRRRMTQASLCGGDPQGVRDEDVSDSESERRARDSMGQAHRPARVRLADEQGDQDKPDATAAERYCCAQRKNGRDDVEKEQLLSCRGSFDERPAGVARVIDLVDLLVGEIVESRGGDVARGERECSHEVPRAELQPSLPCRAQEHEEYDHRRYAIAQHDEIEARELRHFGVTTLSGQIDVSTST